MRLRYGDWRFVFYLLLQRSFQLIPNSALSGGSIVCRILGYGLYISSHVNIM